MSCQSLSRVFRGSFALPFFHDGGFGSFDRGAVDGDGFDVLTGWDFEHDVEHDFFEDGAEGPGAGAALDRFFGTGGEGVLGDFELRAVEGELLFILLHERVFGLGKDLDEFLFGEFTQGRNDREAADELGDESEVEKVFRADFAEEADVITFFFIEVLAGFEPKDACSKAAADDVLHTDEGSTADKENLFGVDLDILLLRVLATALRGDVTNGSLEDFEKGLLDAFARDVARDGDVFGLAADFVDLIDVDDAALGLFDVEVGRLEEAKNDVFDVFTNVAGFGQGGGIDDAERDVEDAGERLSEESLSGAGGAEEEDVGFFDFYIDEFVIEDLVLTKALVVIVNRNGEDFFGLFLADDVVIEMATEFGWSRNFIGEGFFTEVRERGVLACEFLTEDGGADVDTFIANVDTGSGDEFLNL